MSLTPGQRRAIKNEEAARVLVESLNERIEQQDTEIQGLRANYADTQDKYDKMNEKYHNADTLSKVLESKSEALAGIEFIKIVISGVLLSWGFLLIGQSNKDGLWLIGGAVVAYVVALLLQKTIATRKNRKRVE